MDATENYPHKWLALIGLCLLSFTSFLDYTIVTTALPFIQRDLQATVNELQWLLNIMAMIQCMFMIVAGRAGDIWGRKRIFYFGFILFTIAAIGAATSQNIFILIFFRGIQAFSGSIIFTVGVTLLPQAFPPSQQTQAISIFSAFNGLGLSIGPFLGGVLITLFNWRWVFWVNLPFIIVGFFMSCFTLKPSPKPDSKIKIDWWGFFLLVVGLGCLVYGIIYGQENDWNGTSIALIVIGIICLILLVYVENKVTNPLLDLQLFKNKLATLSAITCIAAGIVSYVFVFFDPLYFKLIRDQSAFYVGLTLLSVTVIQVIISLMLAKLLKLFSVYQLLVFGIAATAISAFIHVFFHSGTSIIIILLAMILMGYTWGIANAGGITAITNTVDAAETGTAIGTIFTLWNLSGAIFLALSTVIFHLGEHATMSHYFHQNHIILKEGQHSQIRRLLSDPDQALQILKHLSIPNPQVVFNYFKLSFLNGYHWAYWFCTLISIIALLLGLLLRPQKPV